MHEGHESITTALDKRFAQMNPRMYCCGIYLLFFIIFSIVLINILIHNDGHFTYTLDDPYIHLKFSKELSKGHFGINSNEYSSPASSILWPFLLVPFVNTLFIYYLPLIYNVLLTCVCIAVLILIVGRTLQIENPKYELLKWTTVFCYLFILNLFGLIFVGMETTLQVTMTLLMVLGIFETLEKKIPWWLPVSMILGPLVRYELLSISLSVALFLFSIGYKRVAIMTACLTIAPVIGYSFYLKSMNLDWLPNSVIIKMNDANISFSIRKIYRKLIPHNIKEFEMEFIGIILFFTFLSTLKTKSLRFLAGITLLIIIAHFILGQWGWFNRYEIYLVAFVIPISCYIYRLEISKLIFSQPPIWGFFAIITFSSFLFFYYILDLFTIPLASHNIYLQQYQMHRFISQYYQRSVAVNDIGLVSMDNSEYVLDLVGLASKETRDFQNKYPDSWLKRLLEQHKEVDLIMIYDSWFEGQKHPVWCKLAVLSFDEKRITPADDKVAFYLVNFQSAYKIMNKLEQFKKTLPKGAYLEIFTPDSCMQQKDITQNSGS